MRTASAYAPGHLTGCFEICDSVEDPIMKGSRGVGVSIKQGVYTRVYAEASTRMEHTVWINGKLTRDAVVSENILNKMLSMADGPRRLTVEHTVETPLGAGFGSSGGGAITLALTLNEVLNLYLSFTEAAQIAHVAEIECHTGLGTVYAATVGGFGCLYHAGGPGVGRSVKYPRSEELSVVYIHFGPISTNRILTDPEMRRRINEFGGTLVDKLYKDLRPDLFMELSRRFTENVGLVTPRLRRVLDAADGAGVTATMAMFGEVAFSLAPSGEAEDIAKVFTEAAKGQQPKIVRVDDQSVRMI